jgi:hypothetical protein
MNDIDLLNVDLNLLKAFDALVERPLSSHAYPPLLAKPDRHLVLNPRQTIARGSVLRERFRTRQAHRRLRRELQPNRPSIRLDYSGF